MESRIEIAINHILDILYETPFLSNNKFLKSTKLKKETCYYSFKQFPIPEENLLYQISYNKNGWIQDMKSSDKHGNLWETDDMFIYEFKKTHNNELVQTKFDEKGTECGRIITRFNNESRIIYEESRNEDYEEGFRKTFSYNQSGQILKISFLTRHSKGNPNIEFNFKWKGNSLNFIEVINHQYDKTFYKEYFFFFYTDDSIEVKLNRRAFVDKMQFKFKDEKLIALDRSVSPIGRQIPKCLKYHYFLKKNTEQIIKAEFVNQELKNSDITTIKNILLSNKDNEKSIMKEFEIGKSLNNQEYEAIIKTMHNHG